MQEKHPASIGTLWLGAMTLWVAAAVMAAEGEFRIVKRGGMHHLELSAPIRDAMTRYNPSFRAWSDDDYLPMIREFYAYSEHAAPFAVIGDFNADGAADAVLDGRTDEATVVLALISKHDGKYVAVEVTSGLGSVRPREEFYDVGGGVRQFGRWVFLRRRVDPGRVASPFVADEAVLRGHGFEIEWWEKAALLYYWERGTFKALVVAD